MPQYPPPAIPFSQNDPDFNVIGKEMANDLVVGAMMKQMSDQRDRDAVIDELEPFLFYDDKDMKKALESFLRIEPSEQACIPIVRKYFRKHLDSIISELE